MNIGPPLISIQELSRHGGSFQTIWMHVQMCEPSSLLVVVVIGSPPVAWNQLHASPLDIASSFTLSQPYCRYLFELRALSEATVAFWFWSDHWPQKLQVNVEVLAPRRGSESFLWITSNSNQQKPKETKQKNGWELHHSSCHAVEILYTVHSSKPDSFQNILFFLPFGMRWASLQSLLFEPFLTKSCDILQLVSHG